MSRLKPKIRVGITMGDPSGIGPYITSLAIKKLQHLAEFIVIGDQWVFKKAVGRPQASGVRFIDLENVDRKNFKFGKIKAEYGKASIEYLDKAMELIKNKAIDCLVTCPISKEAIHLAGYTFGGHTEYLREMTGRKDLVMMLLNQRLKFSLVTRHIPLGDVPGQLDQDKICSVVSLTRASLRELFRIKNPRIVICGLNPHASDNGVIGKEENKIIKPAISRLRKKYKDIYGPSAADVAISKADKKEYDCVIALYHDQALIPLKLLGGQKGVNMTLGLGFIRTSPLHGTAFDIAGKNLANPQSLKAAISLAIECTINQKKA